MHRRELFWKALATLSLGTIARPVHAQSAVTVGGGGSRTLPGIVQANNAYEFLAPDGSAALPIAFSYFRPGIPEPTRAEMVWFHIDVVDGKLLFEIRTSWNGTPFTVFDAKRPLSSTP